MINPYDVANRIGNATEDDFFGQMKAVNPGGIVLAKPEWSPDGSRFAALTWNGGKVEAVRYDTNLDETGRAAVNLQVDRENGSIAFVEFRH
jgi:Tol biopolymer transport system component